MFLTEWQSATLNAEVEALKKLVLRNPVVLKLQQSDLPDTAQLAQSIIKSEPSLVTLPHSIACLVMLLMMGRRCSEDDKFLLMLALLKLQFGEHLAPLPMTARRTIKGKTLVFVNGIDRCYRLDLAYMRLAGDVVRLKLFLEQFSIKSCVLNSELPINTRPALLPLPHALTYEQEPHRLAVLTGRVRHHHCHRRDAACAAACSLHRPHPLQWPPMSASASGAGHMM